MAKKYRKKKTNKTWYLRNFKGIYALQALWPNT